MRKPNKKAARKPAQLQLRKTRGELVFDDRIDKLVVDEARVIELSIRYFNDPEPCFIHRGAVLSRVFGELEAVLTDQWIAIDQLDAEIQCHLNAYSAREIRILRGEA